MKKSILFLMLCISLSAYSQAVFVVQGATEQSAHLSLTAAVDAASDGDYIYLPGGTYNIGGLDITKRLNLIGAGHYPDSTEATGRTVLAGTLYFSEGSSHSMLQGVHMHGNIQMGKTDTTSTVENILISRCQVGGKLCLSYKPDENYGSKNIFIRETIIYGWLQGAYTQGVVIENSIIVDRTEHFNGNCSFNNCIFLEPSRYLSARYVFSEVHNCVFNNCIFRTENGSYNGPSSTINGKSLFFNHCIFRSIGIEGGVSYINCLFEQDFAALFKNPDVDVNHFSYDFDYHLSDDSPAKGQGIGGTDCGIYGGDNPCKESAVPLNPHIQFIDIPVNTDNQGKLNIQIRASAQEK